MSAPVRLVLVSPMHPGNVGACARVAANFGVRDIRLVSPQCDWKGPEAKAFGKGPARAVLLGMREAASLGEALSDCSVAVGFTRRSGTLRQARTRLSQLAGLLEGAQKGAALVFGREDRGLSRSELLQCSHVCTIPADSVMPSLNLSHAVAVALSQVYEEAASGSRGAAAKTEITAATVAEVEALVSHWEQAMVDAGITEAGNPARMLAHIRRVLQRAELSRRDVRILRGYLSKTQVAMGTRRRGRRVANPA